MKQFMALVLGFLLAGWAAALAYSSKTPFADRVVDASQPEVVAVIVRRQRDCLTRTRVRRSGYRTAYTVVVSPSTSG